MQPQVETEKEVPAEDYNSDSSSLEIVEVKPAPKEQRKEPFK